MKQAAPAIAPMFPNLVRKTNVERRPRPIDDEIRDDPHLAPQPLNGFASMRKAQSNGRPAKSRRTLTEKEMEVINKIMDDIDHAEKSDVEAPGFEGEFQRYLIKAQKRALDTDRDERLRRKVSHP